MTHLETLGTIEQFEEEYGHIQDEFDNSRRYVRLREAPEVGYRLSRVHRMRRMRQTRKTQRYLQTIAPSPKYVPLFEESAPVLDTELIEYAPDLSGHSQERYMELLHDLGLAALENPRLLHDLCDGRMINYSFAE